MNDNNNKQTPLNKKYLFGLILLLLVSFTGGISLYQSLQYDFKTLDGTKHKYSDFEQHVVLVNYFAEWCAPCLREIPELNEFSHQAPDNVSLFAISYDELSVEKIAELKSKYDIQFPLITELKTALPFDKPDYLPATFIIKPGGQLAGQLLGEQSLESLNEASTSVIR